MSKKVFLERTYAEVVKSDSEHEFESLSDGVDLSFEDCIAMCVKYVQQVLDTILWQALLHFKVAEISM